MALLSNLLQESYSTNLYVNSSTFKSVPGSVAWSRQWFHSLTTELASSQGGSQTERVMGEYLGVRIRRDLPLWRHSGSQQAR